MALCGKCGNALGNGTRCARCGSEDLQELDHVNAGTWGVRDQRTVVGDWDNEASLLPKRPTRQSMRDVRRESRKRNRGDGNGALSPKRSKSNSLNTTLWRVFGVLLLAVFILYQYFPSITGRLTGRSTPSLRIGSTQVFQSPNIPTTHIAGLSAFAAMVMVLVIAYFAIVIIVARSAGRKGRSAVAWFFLAWFFPVISWIIVASMTPSSEAVAERDFRAGRAIQCPSCREIIKRDASVCRHCGRQTHR
jgi:RNA polymerase subunit RPABC4/transcription elongation factor Spt4